MRVKTWKQARRIALATYRKAVRLAEKGDWKAADDLINLGDNCAFCKVQKALRPKTFLSATSKGCPDCPVRKLCRTYPDLTAQVAKAHYDILSYHLTAKDACDRLRKTVAALEALEV